MTEQSVKGIIFNIQRFAIHDGPGIRTTVFFKGCPLRCWWCHNPESHKILPEKFDGCNLRRGFDQSFTMNKDEVGKEISVDELMNEIIKDRVFYEESSGGVTFSGGEPLMQPDFLYELLHEFCLAYIFKSQILFTILTPEGIINIHQLTGGYAMVPIMSLWLPILLSAVAVFIISSIIHMVLGYHANDYKALPSEQGVMNDLRKHNIPPGDYMFPRAGSMKEMGSPDFIEKMKQGPVGIITIMKRTTPGMTKELILWFIYSIIVGVFAAYVAGRALPEGAHYLSVFRFAGVTAFAGYSLALLQNSIWYKRNWSATIKSMFDGLIYALFTAGIFGWLWPGV